MTEINMNSVQNRFTAYLVAAVTNQRIHYMERKRHLQNLEFVQNDLQEKNIWTLTHSTMTILENRQNLLWRTGKGFRNCLYCSKVRSL